MDDAQSTLKKYNLETFYPKLIISNYNRVSTYVSVCVCVFDIEIEREVEDPVFLRVILISIHRCFWTLMNCFMGGGSYIPHMRRSASDFLFRDHHQVWCVLSFCHPFSALLFNFLAVWQSSFLKSFYQ